MNDWKNTIKRALKTFVQAALAYAAANIAGLVGGDGITKDALSGLAVSAVAAGLAALMNLPDHAGRIEGVEEVLLPTKQKRGIEDINELPLAGQDEPEATSDKDIIRGLMGQSPEEGGDGDE